MKNKDAVQAADSQEPYYVRMARHFPTIYRLPTQDELAEAVRVRTYPIANMKYGIDQEVQHYLSRAVGTIENCTKHMDGRLQYTVRWADGKLSLHYESDLRKIGGQR